MVLEREEHALARGAKIYCELAGYGSSGDAEHVTTAREDGKGAAQAMLAALEDANVEGDQVRKKGWFYLVLLDTWGGMSYCRMRPNDSCRCGVSMHMPQVHHLVTALNALHSDRCCVSPTPTH